MSSWAAPGVRCVCIIRANGYWENDDGEGPVGPVPVADCDYTVSRVDADGSGVYIALQELGDEDTYDVRFFRPVAEEADDLALFTHHLDRVGEPA